MPGPTPRGAGPEPGVGPDGAPLPLGTPPHATGEAGGLGGGRGGVSRAPKHQQAQPLSAGDYELARAQVGAGVFIRGSKIGPGLQVVAGLRVPG